MTEDQQGTGGQQGRAPAGEASPAGSGTPAAGAAPAASPDPAPFPRRRDLRLGRAAPPAPTGPTPTAEEAPGSTAHPVPGVQTVPEAPAAGASARTDSPRRQAAERRRVEAEAERVSGPIPIVTPAMVGAGAAARGETASGAAAVPAVRTGSTAHPPGADSSDAASTGPGSTDPDPGAPAADLPESAYGHGFVTPIAAPEAPPAGKDYGRAGRNLPAAIGVGVLLGGGVFASLLFYPPSFLIIALAGILAAMWELANALSRSGSVVARVPTITAASCMLLATYLGGREALWVTFTVGAGAILLFTLFERRPNPVKDVCLSLFALTYVGLMAAFVVHMLTFEQGNLLVICFLSLVVASDVGGYAFGVLWGKHPIAPRISPKKSWEGYAGSAIIATAVGMCMAGFVFDAPLWTGAVLGFVIPAFATLGDFSESMIKRDLDLKDMGTLLPGHGGVMDRLDSILPTAPIALILFSFLPGYIT
ncbi:phosphatidate cytidylyltransferase [Brevibacterium pityocampae]|uniref:Phosphatidate cytidylyltransferase n=1 Tax=Brevibacterium pityocampae TaxID=506594 RepID=A0ABP8JTY9_9MICO